jgi:UDP-N-acetylglucosamine 2-epimerase (non-hydrolysing)
MKIINIVGARPNFMKMAPIIEALNRYPEKFNHLLVHTGQHYDQRMSKAFFDDLGIPKPDIDLEVGSGSHAEQTAKIMMAFEKVCLQHNPDLVIVVGDVNSTMACTITAKKLGIRVAHVEAGLRSGDIEMPEEINRLCTDVLCDDLFTTDNYANENLLKEGIAEEKIHFVGNVMIDTLMKHRAMAKQLPLMDKLGLEQRGFATLTLHRPSNVDDKQTFKAVLEALHEISQKIPIVFPIHPRTRKMADEFGFNHFFTTGDKVEGLWLTDPLGYLEFLHLNMNARMVLTDSGGLQEESTVLGIPCITLRFNTERPITCTKGTNILVGNDKQRILEAANKVLGCEFPEAMIPEKWDGKTADRIVKILMEHSNSR